MQRGSSKDFWRSVRLGLRLADNGWVPSILEIDRSLTIPVEGRLCKARLFATADYRGCHAGGMIWPPPNGRIAGETLINALRKVAGPGKASEENDWLTIRRGMSRLVDLTNPPANRSVRARSKLARARIAALILKMLAWLRSRERSGWSALSLLFRRTRWFRSQGVPWKLFSDLYFYRGEGFYWNNFLTSIAVDRAMFRRLARAGFYERAGATLKQRGFRVASPHPAGLVFDQDFLPSGALIHKAIEMEEWKP